MMRRYILAVIVSCGVGCESQQPSPVSRSSESHEQYEQLSASTVTEGDEKWGDRFTDAVLDRIESELEIKLPAAYRNFMLTRSNELRKYTYPLRGETEIWFSVAFFDLSVDRMIAENIDQRSRDMAAGEAFPEWWTKYVFIGTNGGGDYFAMRLDGTPEIWFLDCDGRRTELFAKSLDDFFAKTREGYDEKLKVYHRLEALFQRKEIGDMNEEDFAEQWQEILSDD